MTGKTLAPERLEKLFGKIGWLSRQSADFRSALLLEGCVIRIGRGDAIFREGDQGGSLYGVIAGGVGVMLGPPLLSPRLGHIMRAGTWFGFGPILSGGNRSLEFRAMEPSMLLALPMSSLLALEQRDRETFRRIGELANIGVDLGARIAAELLIPISARRVGAVLLRVALPETQDDHVPPDSVMITQTQLAEMSNMSRNLVNTALRQFKAAGWIETHYNQLRITDAAALGAFAYAED